MKGPKEAIYVTLETGVKKLFIPKGLSEVEITRILHFKFGNNKWLGFKYKLKPDKNEKE